jgi:hypothetical protein
MGTVGGWVVAASAAACAGADIDTVGAISTTLTPVPLPAAAWLLLSGLVGFASIGRRRR